MRAEGTVLRTDGENAQVEFVRRSACAGCESCGAGCESCGAGCGGCHKSVKQSITVKNEIGAETGDKVYIESSTGVIFALCAILFLLPLIIAGAVYAVFWGGKDSGAGALAAFATALSAFALLYLTAGKRLVGRCRFRIVKKL